ncbi:MAG: acetyl-CoA hydrolase/transferase family protein [Chloroflexi bacterium]|nr:acetyl-CoA hydrolase/transferase family protein [Chloroflexota bacterium]
MRAGLWSIDGFHTNTVHVRVWQMTSVQDEYQKKLITAEQAAALVKPGDLVSFSFGRQAVAVGRALAVRKEELKGLRVRLSAPVYDFGWYSPGWEEYFSVSVFLPTPVCQEAVDAGRIDLNPGVLFPGNPMAEPEPPDVLVVELSPPDEKGFCSFGQSLWNKKQEVGRARLVIAEVNGNLIRTYGENFVHMSEIDYFVAHVPTGRKPGDASLTGKTPKLSEPYLKHIASLVSGLIRDGDTIQIGIGRATEPLVSLGMLGGKRDIGYHSEATTPGVISLVRQGVINGKRKTLNPDKVVITSVGGSTREEMDWVNNNPCFWLMPASYIEDIRIIASHDNMVAINSALSMDLTGQINAETVDGRYISGPGGQIPFVIGALLSRGGRGITVMPSTARDGAASRIVPEFPAGASVSIQRCCADIVVTEFGVANLRGKTLRQRAEELIAIAHPDFRGELKKHANSKSKIRMSKSETSSNYQNPNE